VIYAAGILKFEQFVFRRESWRYSAFIRIKGDTSIHILKPSVSLPIFQPFAGAQLFQVELLPEQKNCAAVFG
jgi:hypothetical protein